MKKQKGKLYLTSFSSRIGPVHLASTGKGVAGVAFGGEGKGAFRSRMGRQYPDYDMVEEPSKNREAVEAVQSALAEKGGDPKVPIDVRGTPFQRKVWQALRRIPRGKALSYGEVARRIGKPGAARAVGGACRSNPAPLIVPCHRVIGSDGSMTGFGGGSNTSLKRKLLEMEGWREDRD